MVENNLVVTCADKNMGLTIMDFAWYNDQVKKHLGDRTVYVKMQNEWVFESINAYAELFKIVYDCPSKYITDWADHEFLNIADPDVEFYPPIETRLSQVQKELVPILNRLGFEEICFNFQSVKLAVQ